MLGRCFGDTGGLVWGVAGAVLFPLPPIELRSNLEPTRDGGADPEETIKIILTAEKRINEGICKLLLNLIMIFYRQVVYCQGMLYYFISGRILDEMCKSS